MKFYHAVLPLKKRKKLQEPKGLPQILRILEGHQAAASDINKDTNTNSRPKLSVVELTQGVGAARPLVPRWCVHAPQSPSHNPVLPLEQSRSTLMFKAGLLFSCWKRKSRSHLPGFILHVPVTTHFTTTRLFQCPCKSRAWQG